MNRKKYEYIMYRSVDSYYVTSKKNYGAFILDARACRKLCSDHDESIKIFYNNYVAPYSDHTILRILDTGEVFEWNRSV